MGYMRDSSGRRLDSFKVAGFDSIDRPPRNINGRGRVGTNQSNGTDTSQTSRLRFVMRQDAGSVRLVFQNFYTPSGNNEPPNTYNVTVKASVEDPSNNLGNPGGTILIPVFFNGQRTATMAPGGVLVSDPVLINVAAASNLWVRSMPTVAAGDKWINNYVSSNNTGSNFDGGGGSEGVVANTDAVDSGSVATSLTNAFGPSAIVTVSPAVDVPAVLILGDSISAETGIITTGNTSYLSRACINAGLPITRLAEGGERMSTILTGQFYWKRMQFARFARHAVSNYGTNDIYSGSASLATMKANYLSFWKMLARLGLQVHQATILPRPGASTDGYMTVASQSITNASAEAVRTGVNSWLRDAGGGGAKAQSGGALKSIIDPCSLVEVNSSGALTLNGGYWKPAPGGVVKTGTATSYTTTSVTDSGATRTVNADQNLVLAITSAATGAGQAMVVSSNTSTVWTLLSAITLPTGTVTYQLGHSYLYDGTHPTEEAHNYMGDGLNLAYLSSL